MNKEIPIISYPDYEHRGHLKLSNVLTLGNPQVADMQKELQEFCSSISGMLESLECRLNSYELSEVVIKAGVSAGGKFAIIGSGASLGVTGGVELKFSRSVNNGL